jgi:hypothetical protein
MFIRKAIKDNRKLGGALASVLITLAFAAVTYQFWPQRKPELAMAFFTDDDGKSWFADSLDHVAPFDHDGKEAVLAEVYTFDDGSKKFCAFLEKYTPDAKRQLEAAMADAKAQGLGPDTVKLQRDPTFVQSGLMVKSPGSQSQWVHWNDPNATKVLAIQSPDGSTIDACFVY